MERVRRLVRKPMMPTKPVTDNMRFLVSFTVWGEQHLSVHPGMKSEEVQLGKVEQIVRLMLSQESLNNILDTDLFIVEMSFKVCLIP